MAHLDSHVRRARDALAADRGIVAGLRAGEALASAAGLANDSTAWLRGLLEGVHQRDDQLLAIASIHAISAVRGDAAATALTRLLVDEEWHVAEHAAWALSARSSHRPAMSTLSSMVAGGGFTGMLAQRTLGGWASADGEGVLRALVAAADTTCADGARRRLTETIGLVPGPRSTDRLERIALDSHEGILARQAAASALGDRGAGQEILLALADGDDALAQHALLALGDSVPATTIGARRGLRVAQLFLHADLGAGAARAGAGDSGGIATLLGLLSAEMAGLPGVDEVITIGRGRAADALAVGWRAPGDAERFAVAPFGPPGGVDMRAAWPYRVEIERGLRRVFRAVAPLDAVHLRMADVGTLAAARVARHLDVPVVFTAAPDPHVVLRALGDEGALTRSNFGASDSLEHWWFRARMVERLAATADRVALLPRVGIRDEVHDLLGYDAARAVVIPEGVHAATVRDAARVVRRPGAPPAGAVADLASAIAGLPTARRSLPLIVSVGRLHPMKGMDRIVRAWAGSDALRAAANVVIVGGDLETPSPDELDVLTTIDDIAEGHDGVILLGHRPHAQVAQLLAAAAVGTSSVPGGGIYVGGARKEEFGLAIIEAVAAGLPVVAPAGGGPTTYVTAGVDGVLVDPSSATALADGMVEALRLARVPGRADAASARILGELTIERMAERLVQLYGSLVRVRS